MERLEEQAVEMRLVREYQPGELAKMVGTLAANATVIREQKAKQ